MKISFAGDVMLSRNVDSKIDLIGNKNFLSPIRKELFSADISCVNLECPVTSEPPRKHGFGAKPENLQVIEGCTIVNIANNHILDCSHNGLIDTIKYLREENILFTGVYDRDDKGSPVVRVPIVKCGDIKVAFVGITSTKFFDKKLLSNSDWNVLCVEDWSLVNDHIQFAKKNADLTFAIFHDGIEFTKYPAPFFKVQCKKFINAGCDHVIGHHSHVFSGFEKYQEAMIFYSLGDFVFDSNHPQRKRTAILSMDFNGKENSRIELIPITANKHFQPTLLTDKKASRFLKRIEHISSKIKRGNYDKKFRFYHKVDIILYQFARMVIMIKEKGLSQSISFILKKVNGKAK